MEITEEWFSKENKDYDEDVEHRKPNEEIMFYRNVAEGNLDAVRASINAHRFSAPEGAGVLSRDPVQNLKYHFVIGAALIARICIEEGMELEKSFRLSDFYIQKLDNIHRVKDVEDLHARMVMDYTRRMQVSKRNSSYSRPINECMNYIYTHIKERITIDDLADYTSNSTSYISRLFKEELGISASDYIRKMKIEKSKNLLRYSEYSLVDIANYLAFASQSHFIQIFSKEVGMTPKNYREKYFNTYWKADTGYWEEGDPGDSDDPQ